ncbi:MAG: BREX-1 system adenine-specific DNA-methyltransferase PglX, partial [Accumulibacter sp.]|uniref:BREX-1 system adenine-specific DNA-methyltransferase PglX n=1 Tax=Accumulibacter sp. TaxID=2053492 RepID=UPI0033152026
MNKARLKTYAPQARKDFIAAVVARANLLGISEKDGKLEIAPSERKGDVTLIAGQAWPAKVHEQRERLIKRMQKTGAGETAEAIAYTWFNRFAALRYMEIHDYLGHGHRVLSSREGGLPEILTHATELAGVLPGMNVTRVADMKLAGNKDGELYRLLLVAQCNALSSAMPFLFERIDDESELLLPDNLIRTDSLIRSLVDEIPEADWADIEIVGWLYQFYISEKKDQVIGKVVKSEDIPAATQLFTPNWIVKYMVQNSLGAQWLATYPDSKLKGQMEYYIEPAEQTDEVKAQLAAITPSQLNPEDLTLIDPACGSGHILVESYELFKAIYLERGYRQRDVAQLILEKNLFGLDIDERATQLTGFALMMKGRADDRRLFERGVKLNVMALVDSVGFDAEALANGTELSDYGLKPGDLTELKRLFEHATTFGSLIQVPESLTAKLPALKQLSGAIGQDLFVSEALKRLGPLVQQAELLAAQYDAVVANPPYIGSKYHTPFLKNFLKDHYSGYEKDLFSAFVVRCSAMGASNARIGMMSPNVWMYISSHEPLRELVLSTRMLLNLVELPLSGFKGATVQICSFVFRNAHVSNSKGGFIRLVEFTGGDAEMAAYTKQSIQNSDCGWYFEATPDEFRKIPGRPIAYFATEKLFSAFTRNRPLEEYGLVRQGAATSDNDRFLRLWWEVATPDIGFGFISLEEANGSGKKWFPYNKGGPYRKWYGNHEFLINYQCDGQELKQFQSTLNQGWTVRLKSREYYFGESVSWPKISSGSFSARYYPNGFIFDVAGCCYFPKHHGSKKAVVAFLNSNVVASCLNILSPTLNFEIEQVKKIPFIELPQDDLEFLEGIFAVSYSDWNVYERSWNFQSIHILTAHSDAASTLESSYTAWITQNRDTIAEMKRLEEENNRLFIDAYGLADELSPDVPLSQITLTVNPAYRYGGKLSEEEQWTRFRQDTMQELVSYAIGCMMGRYSLDEPGLIYAHAGNVGFDATRYKTFPADADGIVPINDELWFEDDAANRVREFLRATWGAEKLDQNVAWLAENLGTKANETPDETIRRYLASNFFKDHLQTYKKRPIYWLFSSGKQGAFQALVYLHRYHEGTLARLRAEYVVPLTGKMQSRIEMLEKDKDAATSTAARNRIARQIEALKKKHVELLA